VDDSDEEDSDEEDDDLDDEDPDVPALAEPEGVPATHVANRTRNRIAVSPTLGKGKLV